MYCEIVYGFKVGYLFCITTLSASLTVKSFTVFINCVTLNNVSVCDDTTRPTFANDTTVPFTDSMMEVN